MSDNLLIKVRPSTTDPQSSSFRSTQITSNLFKDVLNRKMIEKKMSKKIQFPTLRRGISTPYNRKKKKRVHLFDSLPYSFTPHRFHPRKNVTLIRRRAKTPTARHIRKMYNPKHLRRGMISRRGHRKVMKRKKKKRRNGKHESGMKSAFSHTLNSTRKNYLVTRNGLTLNERPLGSRVSRANSRSGMRRDPYLFLTHKHLRKIDPKFSSIMEEIEDAEYSIPNRKVKSKYEDVVDCPNLRIAMKIDKRNRDYSLSDVKRRGKINKKKEKEMKFVQMKSDIRFENPYMIVQGPKSMTKKDKKVMKELFDDDEGDEEEKTEETKEMENYRKMEEFRRKKRNKKMMIFNPLVWLKKNNIKEEYFGELFSEYLLDDF